MVLMPVYVETAEGLVKPLVILPAAVMPFVSLIFKFLMTSSSLLSLLIHSFTRPTLPLIHLTNHSHTPYCLCSLLFPLSYLIQEHFLFMAEQCS